MTTHLRDDIREACVSALVAAGTAAGSRVHDHPYDPRTEFPALVVEDDSEQQDLVGLSNDLSFDRAIARVYVMAVSAEVRQIAGYARQRGSLLAEVEVALAAATLPGNAAVKPTGYQALQSNDGEVPVAVGRQLFEIQYFTPQSAPGSAT